MFPGQGEARFGMIETRNGLPVVEAVALRAILTQSPAMCIFVAGNAVLRESQEGAIQILSLQTGTFCGEDMGGVVALPTRERRMFSLQRVARLVVVEGLLRRLPMNDLEIDAVVLGVAAPTLLVIGLLH